MRLIHNCRSAGGGREWSHCTGCDGRLHIPGCTAKLNPKRDCCAARHKLLFDAGITRGIYDDSFAMYPEGLHDPDSTVEQDAKLAHARLVELGLYIAN
jgi:hypothetical protein